MTFCEKTKIDLLILPDFLGFIHRKSLEFINQQNVDNDINKKANENYIKLQSTRNFHFVNIPNEVIEQTIEIVKQ